MRVLFIMTSLAGGGAEKVLVDLLRYTDYSKYEIDLCLVSNKGIYLNQIPSDVRLVYLYKKSEIIRYKIDFVLARYFSLNIFQRKRIEKVIGKNHFDVIISFMDGIPVRFHNYIIQNGKKNISWVHLDLLKHHYTSKYFRGQEEKKAYEKMDAVACVSNDAKNSLQRLFLLKIPLVTLYNPIDRDLIRLRSHEFVPDKKRFTICAVGRLMFQKRFDRLIRLAHNLRVRKLDVDFWIVGTGSLENELKQLSCSLNVKDLIHFWGFQSNPYPYMQAADMFLSTSMAEGYPLVICEALCLGKPIVATNVTGPSEILGNSDFGLLTGEDDESIFKAVNAMISDESLRNHYAQRALEKAEAFDIMNTVNTIYNFIQG